MPRPSALLIALALPLLASFSDAFSLAPSLRPGRPNPAAGVHRARPAAARTVLCSAEAPALSNAPEEEAATPIYACPQCGTPCSLDQGSCGECGAPFTPRGGFVDMTPEATKVDAPKEESEVRRGQAGSILATAIASSGVQLPGRPLRQELFRTPMVSWMYERGWRNSFKQAGFPGIEREFELVQEFFEDKANKTVIDLSCGSGLMVRRLASSDRYGKVIAVDFSESMLGEVVKRAEEEKCPSFDVVRADVANMPFGDNTIDAIHSGEGVGCRVEWDALSDPVSSEVLCRVRCCVE